ncbi:hypothetical protein L1987_52097 [Smallanthus sonchifolius]|uniref:Uncharacterized protein n=1 Tax=Smallanthus sonchifolius TaxID=185202 RepID=A0ACB9ESL1_9ASTR|nr:hypothetical protein L1987_52097 [Smallanthus sonchifolius]
MAGIVADPNSFDQSKRMRTGGDYTHTGFSSPSPFHPPPAPVWGPHGYMAPPPPPYDPYGGYPVSQVPMAPPPALPAPVPAPSSYMPVQYVSSINTKDNPPCNTLFIGNLGENINEEDLRGLFSMQPGFKQMKVLRQERHTVCFIEFEDVNSATNVHHSLQGAVIPSSGSVGMRMQYPYTFWSLFLFLLSVYRPSFLVVLNLLYISLRFAFFQTIEGINCFEFQFMQGPENSSEEEVLGSGVFCWWMVWSWFAPEDVHIIRSTGAREMVRIGLGNGLQKKDKHMSGA